MKKGEYLDLALKALIEKYPKLSEKLVEIKKQKKSCLTLFQWTLFGDTLKRIYEYHFLMSGILSKTQSLSESFMVDLFLQNPYSLNMILRANYESLAALHYYRKYPETRKRVIWGDKYLEKKTDVNFKSIHINEMLRELDKDTPGWMNVMDDYEEMSQIVHPNRKSHLANTRVKEESDQKYPLVLFSSTPELKEEEIEVYLNAQINLVNQILINLRELDDDFCKANKIQKETPKIKGETK